MGVTVAAAEANPAVCPDCGAPVEPLTLEFDGRRRTVYPVCSCQAAKEKRAQLVAAAAARVARARRLYESCRLGKQYQDCTFDNFEVLPGNCEAYNLAKEFAEKFPGDGLGLLILGGVGSGKTHLAAAITLHLLAIPVPVLFASTPELLDTLRAAAGDDIPESTAALMAQVQTADLLVLDDLGAERLTEWAEERLFLVVDYRYRNALPMVVTTNCSLEELAARVQARTFSRLLAMTRTVAIDCPDRRLRQSGRDNPGKG